MPKDAYETWLEIRIAANKIAKKEGSFSEESKMYISGKQFAYELALTQYQQFKKENDEEN